MNYLKMSVFLMLTLLIMIPLSACSSDTGQSSESGSSQLTDESESSSSEISAEETGFSYSDAFYDNGYWKNIVASDYVQLPEIDTISVPADSYEISDESVQTEIDNLVQNNPKKVTDASIKDGDTVNIDYVGSVDGVEFDGGSTGGAGTDVIIGETSYVDDFIEQLIGHTPGETFDVEVTFPDNYSAEELQGKDAVFVVTVNYISYTDFEVDDAYVSEYLSETYGWTTVSEMSESIRGDLQTTSVQTYINEYILENSTVETVPELLVEYQENSMINYYQQYADSYGLELDEFLSTYTEYATQEALIEAYAESNKEQAKYYLIIQAISEKLDIVPSEAEVEAYYEDYYSSYVETYGLPFLTQNYLCQNVVDNLTKNTVLE